MMIYKKIDISEAFSYQVDTETAQEFIDWRLSIKKPLTQGAFKRALMAALRCENELPITANQAIEIAIDKGWQGVVFEYIKSEVFRRAEANEQTLITHDDKSKFIERHSDNSWADVH